MKFQFASLAVLALSLGSIAQTTPKPSASAAAKATPFAENVYRNAAFGFRYSVPYGWVERTKEMQEGNDTAKLEVLLAIFERPPQAAGDTVNSAVLIAVENPSTYPGLKKAEDYLGPLTEVTASKGFKEDGDPSVVQVDSQRLVRADYSKELNDKLTMHQCTMVMLSKGQILSFTFIAESVDSVNDMIDRLGFSPRKSKAK